MRSEFRNLVNAGLAAPMLLSTYPQYKQPPRALGFMDPTLDDTQFLFCS
jgi:hypothetical protein